jgi:hypothetical protein
MDEDVLRLDVSEIVSCVPVNNSIFYELYETFANLSKNVNSLFLRDSFLTMNVITKSATIAIFLNYVVVVSSLENVLKGHDPVRFEHAHHLNFGHQRLLNVIVRIN